MIAADAQAAAKFWALILFAIVFSVAAGWAATNFPPLYLGVGAAGFAIALAGFLSPRFGLIVVVFSMIFSPRLQGGGIGSGGHSAVVFKLNDILLIILSFAWLTRNAIDKGGAFLVRTPLNRPMGAFTIVYLLSTFFGVLEGRLEPIRPFFYVLKYVEYYVLYFMTISVVEKKEQVRGYLRYGWMTAVFVTIFGYTQIPLGGRVSAPFDTAVGAEGEVNEPNTFAGYYLVVFGALLGTFTQDFGRHGTVALTSFIFMLPTFLLTLSRGSYMGLLVSMFFHAIATRTRRLALLFGMGGGLALIMTVPVLRDAVLARVEYTFQAKSIGSGQLAVAGSAVHLEGSAFARVASWTGVVTEMFPNHPIVGHGVTGVGLVDAYWPLLLGENGLLGLFCFLWLMSRIARCAWSLARESQEPWERALGLGLLTSMVALFVQSIAANTFIIVRIMEPFWFVVALVMRVYMDRDEEPAAA